MSGVQFCDLVMGDFHTFFERSAKGNRKVNVRLIKIVLSCVALLNLTRLSNHADMVKLGTVETTSKRYKIKFYVNRSDDLASTFRRQGFGASTFRGFIVRAR